MIHIHGFKLPLYRTRVYLELHAISKLNHFPLDLPFSHFFRLSRVPNIQNFAPFAGFTSAIECTSTEQVIEPSPFLYETEIRRNRLR